MANVKFVPDRQGYFDLMNSSAVQKDLLARGQAIAGAAAGSYVVDARAGIHRAHIRVTTADAVTYYVNNVRGHALQGAMGAGKR